jgi:putative endonuclease
VSRSSGVRPPAANAPSRDPRQRLGAAGEALAERELSRSGLTILARRFRCRAGEIDLVALDGRVVVFAEVKTRRGTGFGSPAEAVTARKREHMVRAARVFLAAAGGDPPPCRFDVVEVLPGEDGVLVARHVRDAFRLGLWGDRAPAGRRARRS